MQSHSANLAPPAARRGDDLRFYTLTALGLALFPFVFHLIGGYGELATKILIVGIGAMGFNVLLGYAGLLSYGHAAFYGLGGYIAGLTLIHLLPAFPNLWLTLLITVAAVTFVAWLLGLLYVRLYGIYFALLTLAFAQMVFFIAFKWRAVTRGDDGLQGFPSPSIGPWDLQTPLPSIALGPFGNLGDLKLWYIFVAILTLLVIAFVRTLLRSQFGEVLAAIRENEERSTFVGFNPTSYKLAAIVISGALCGLSGALRSLYDQFAAIDMLGVETSGNLVIYTVVGGVHSLLGPIVGTGLIMYLQNVLSAKTEAWRLIEGLIFIAVIVFMPGGMLGSFKRGAKFSLKKVLK